MERTMNNFSTTQTVRKRVRASDGGVVASQHKLAAMAGVAILEAGGDAIDAAVAASFAVGVVEPWMSGPAGGGMMTVWRESERKSYTVQFGMRSPRALRPADYPLTPERKAGDLFPWTSVLEDRNVFGATAIAVPGTVAGMELAHNRFGRLPWRELLQPAIAYAREGMLVDWYASLIIASATRQLTKDPDAAALFLIDGKWPNISGWTALSQARLDQGILASTLEQLACVGPRDFYEGQIAQTLVDDIRAKGGCLSMLDLAAYRATLTPTLDVAYRGGLVRAPEGLSAGADLVRCLRQMESAFVPSDKPNAVSYRETARALSDTYRERLEGRGDGENPQAPSCTTHFSVVDRHGNMCAVTQTLLSIFGSHVVSPQTGLLMNNGIMWFDPEPGHPNSLAPDKGCLMNVCPIIGEKGERRFAIGSSGGRKIMPAVTHLVSFMLDFDMTLEDAFHHPRVDCSGGGMIIADQELPDEVLEALGRIHPVTTTKRSVFPYAFGVPAGILREGSKNSGCTEIMTPWGDALHAKGIDF